MRRDARVMLNPAEDPAAAVVALGAQRMVQARSGTL